MPKKSTRVRIPDPAEARDVFRKLKKKYGLPRLGNPTDPIDDFIYIVISNKTTPETARRTYERIKAAYPDWSKLAAATL